MNRSTLLLIVLFASLIGCNRLSAPPKSPPAAPVAKTDTKPEPAPEPKKEKRQPKNTALGRTMEISEVTNLMRQLGLAYKNYEIANNRAPQKWQDLKSDYENNAKINEHLEKGWWIFLAGVRPNQMPAGASNTILAYEVDPDISGMRVVVMADATVHRLPEDEFNKAPRAGKK